MDFTTLLRILFTRWYVVLPAIGVTVFAGMTLVEQVEPEFTSDASVVLFLRDDRATTAEDGVEAEPGNPFASSSRALGAMGALLDSVMSDPAFRERVAAGGFSSDYSISVDADSPIVEISATAPTGRQAQDTANALLGELATELDARQDAVGAAETLRIESQVLTAASPPSKVTVARNRAIVSVTLAGLVVVIGLALLVESLAAARRRAKAAAAEDARIRISVASGTIPDVKGLPAFQPQGELGQGSGPPANGQHLAPDDAGPDDGGGPPPASPPTAPTAAPPAPPEHDTGRDAWPESADAPQFAIPDDILGSLGGVDRPAPPANPDPVWSGSVGGGADGVRAVLTPDALVTAGTADVVEEAVDAELVPDPIAAWPAAVPVWPEAAAVRRQRVVRGRFRPAFRDRRRRSLGVA